MAFFTAKAGRGDDATDFPPSQRTDERWYQHDRTSRHSYVNIGIGADWYFSEDYSCSAQCSTPFVGGHGAQGRLGRLARHNPLLLISRWARQRAAPAAGRRSRSAAVRASSASTTAR
jgi:hypothetical protein